MHDRGWLARRAYAYANVFELLIAFFSLLAAVSFALNPAERRATAVGQTLAPYDWLWNIGYGLAGLLIVWGVLRIRPRIEVAGLALLAGFVGINATAVIAVGGLRGWYTLGTYVSVIAACFIRARVLFVASRPPRECP